MTLASDIIKRAYRESNLISINATPSTNENAEGLDLLNTLVQSTIGLEAGQELTDINLGGSFDESSLVAYHVPANARLVCNFDSDKTVKLDPQPYEGQRLAVVDVAGNFSTNSLTLDANGRTVELDPSETLSDDGFYAQWMYFADVADWSRITDIALTDTWAFPVEFDDYFVISLALRLNPRHGAKLAPESMAALARTKAQIQARYRKRRPKNDMPHRFQVNSRRWLRFDGRC